MTTIPQQYKQFCNEREKVVDCPYIMHRLCPGTCKYPKEIMGIGTIQSITKKRLNKLERGLEDDK